MSFGPTGQESVTEKLSGIESFEQEKRYKPEVYSVLRSFVEVLPGEIGIAFGDPL
jgi:hypothetical protein